MAGLIELGLNHEQQHQELILMDIKHVLSQNLPSPVYRRTDHGVQRSPRRVGLVARIEHGGGSCEIGNDGDGFSFDNELPRHRTFLEPFASRPDPGHLRPVDRVHRTTAATSAADLWLSDGWAACRANGWEAPLYWSQRRRILAATSPSGARRQSASRSRSAM